jgi:tRNA G18 (ribose-2'-O)-methylase SpoU
MVTTPALAALADDIDPDGVTVFLVPQAVMNTVTGFNIHRGCLAIGERGQPLEWRALARRARRLVIVERIANPDNIGAIFRNAAAFGADAVLLGPDCADPLYRKSIRTSMAAALAVPFANAIPWPDVLRELRAEGFFVVGLSPTATAPTIRDAAERIGQPVAIVAGHEGDGLTRDAIDACDILARIPISESVDSLNVATAVSIALYELSTAGGRRPADHESRFANHE